LEKIKAYGICLYKKDKHNIKILLCKSVQSKEKWGFLKGVQEKNETNEQTAIREFEEECSIKINKKYLENYFEQINDLKDIGIYLVDANNISNINDFFVNNKLISSYLSWENTQVGFFDITKLPKIKKKQINLIGDIVQYL
jgi:8-oxo-dGTP pyrophosphatase MutT (NUDIX family)